MISAVGWVTVRSQRFVQGQPASSTSDQATQILVLLAKRLGYKKMVQWHVLFVNNTALD